MDKINCIKNILFFAGLSLNLLSCKQIAPFASIVNTWAYVVTLQSEQEYSCHIRRVVVLSTFV